MQLRQLRLRTCCCCLPLPTLVSWQPQLIRWGDITV